MRATSLVLSLSLSLAGLASIEACTAQTNDAPLGSSTTELTQAEASEIYGTYDFVLDESDVAAKFRSACDSKSGGNAANARACYDEIKAEANGERIAFVAGEDGKAIYRSLGTDQGKEVLFREVPVTIAKNGSAAPGKANGARAYTATIRGPGKGPHAAERPMPVGKEFAFERLDERRIAMTDPEKGRLVFRRTH
jgi:hypothetical protein